MAVNKELDVVVTSPQRQKRSNFSDNKAIQVKDIVLGLFFLMGIAAIYTNVNERLVKLETKGEAIAQQLVEMKADTNRVTSKLDDSLRGLLSQIRDVESLIVISKAKAQQEK